MSDKPMVEKLRDAPQFVLWALWCILWPLSKLVTLKPIWYACRAIVELFGYRVEGIPGKELSIGEKSARRAKSSS